MSHLLIIGQSFSSLTNYIESHGHTYTLIQDRLKTKFPDKKLKKRIVADFSTEKNLLSAIDTVKQPVDGVMTVYENYVLPAAWVARHLQLPGLPIPAAEACTDKFLMRSLFAEAPEKISPAFAEISSLEDVKEFAHKHSFPMILKPANLAKSLLVTKNSSLEELLNNYSRSMALLETTYKKYAPNRAPKLIIEEFLDGNIHSVDAFVDNDGTPHVLNEVVDYQTGYDIGYDDNFHYSRILPSKLSVAEQESLRHCADVGIRALGMKNSAAHVEIIMTNGGPRIVEIGARNGGYRERMHRIANGIDITGGALALALGSPLDITATKHDDCAVIELFPRQEGTFKRIENLESVQALPSFNYLSVKAKEGQRVGKAGDGYKMCAVVVLHNTDSSQFHQDKRFIDECVSIVTDK